MSDVTKLLLAIRQGDDQATDELLPVVYEELRLIAEFQFSSEAVEHTLQPTALVNEAFMRLIGPKYSSNDGAPK